MKIIHSEISGIPVLQVEGWQICHGFLGAELDFRFSDQAWEKLNKSEVKLCFLKQEHGAKIADLEQFKQCEEIEADGWIGEINALSQNKLAVGIKTADCTPVLLLGKKHFAALHCGWRSAYKGLLENGVEQMLKRGENLEDIQIAIGPSAQHCCYEVSQDLAEMFRKKLVNDKFTEQIVFIREDKIFLSVSNYLVIQADTLGIPSRNIAKSNKCTICEKSFFSFRRQKDDSGRQVSFISA